MRAHSPTEMTRRHFVQHLATSAATLPTLQFLRHLEAHAAEVQKNQKACILMWMGGGAPTIDLWDLKPGSKNAGEFKPIATNAGYEISEVLSKTAKVADLLSVVRSMSTREADHGRGRYYMHTAFPPEATVVHPTFGSVVSYELMPARGGLEIPAFISVGGSAGSPGYLGMSHAPFVVDSSGRIRDAEAGDTPPSRVAHRLAMLELVETNFIKSGRGDLPAAHRDIYRGALNLTRSEQRKAFQVDEEPQNVRDAYGSSSFGRGLLLARRLVEAGVPFVEVSLDGWDLHNNAFPVLRDQLGPNLDQGFSALVADLKERGLLEHTVLVWMGEFGRTPRINQGAGRDHWAACWSVALGGGGIRGGEAIGATDADGLAVIGKSYVAGDIWATVAKALGIPVDKEYKSDLGRPFRIANGGTPIPELIA